MAEHQRHSTVARRLSRFIAAPFRKELGNDVTVSAASVAHPSKDETVTTASGEATRRSKVIARKTSQLPTLSKAIYHVDHYTSMSGVVTTFGAGLVVMLILGAILGFPNSWVVTFEVLVSSVTLLMVFTIQHTQGREQLATQRKLDELLLATPGAAESLMMLEQAPEEFMVKVEESQRVVRADLVDDVAATGDVDSY